MSERYEIGYRRPPKETQWQPGRSGNPAGGAKRPKSLVTHLDEILKERIIVQVGNKKKRVSKGEALVRTWVAMAFKGDRKAVSLLLGLSSANLARHGGNEGDAPANTADYKALIDSFLRRHGRGDSSPASNNGETGGGAKR